MIDTIVGAVLASASIAVIIGLAVGVALGWIDL